jgi:hypothetical protein
MSQKKEIKEATDVVQGTGPAAEISPDMVKHISELPP